MQSELEVKFKLEGVLVMSGNKVPKVWIDQDLCTGDGLCEEICPGLFVNGRDGVFYVKEPDSKEKKGKGGIDTTVVVPDKLGDLAVEAAEECPGECIFIEKV